MHAHNCEELVKCLQYSTRRVLSACCQKMYHHPGPILCKSPLVLLKGEAAKTVAFI